MPRSEFMVEEHELRKEKIQEDYNDRYWDQRYTVVPQQIPSFLQKMAGKILSTGATPSLGAPPAHPGLLWWPYPPFLLSGKYLNVVRECGHDVTCPVAQEILYTLKERAYVEQIEKAFSYASRVLLDFLMQEQELLAHLRYRVLAYFLAQVLVAPSQPPASCVLSWWQVHQALLPDGPGGLLRALHGPH